MVVSGIYLWLPRVWKWIQFKPVWWFRAGLPAKARDAFAWPADRETFANLSAGRRLRSWLRFAHTCEIYGLTGQTVAGIVSAGGGVSRRCRLRPSTT